MFSYRFICSLLGTLLCIWIIQGEWTAILPGHHIYEVFPSRKIWKINFQYNCSGFGYDRNCEEGYYDESGDVETWQSRKLLRLYRRDLRTGKLTETTTVAWDANAIHQKMWINSSYRQNNDFIKQWITVPLDLWDYTYTDVNARRFNMSLQFTGSHIQIWYNEYVIAYVWLRDQAEDVTYSTHMKLESGFWWEDWDPANDNGQTDKTKFKDGHMTWYYGDESLWCWVNCSQQHVYNFSGYYDEVLSPRTDAYQIYQDRELSPYEHSAFCTYYNCTRNFENYPACLMLNYTVFNITSGQDQTLLDLGCINQTYNLTAEKERAVVHWSQKIFNVTNIRYNGDWNQQVPDDPFGVGIVNGSYVCMQRDYCHDFRPFELFNYGSSGWGLVPDNLVLLAAMLWSALYYRRP